VVASDKVGQRDSHRRRPVAVGRRNGPARRCSKAVVELRWSGRASMSTTVGGGDEGGEAWSKSETGRKDGCIDTCGLECLQLH
jgi:uncharacterized metal-binding protein